MLQAKFNSEVVFHDVDFHYPTRPDAKILQKLNITVRQGQTVALVGSSGCGKSTTVQLIERFYDPIDGQVVRPCLMPNSFCCVPEFQLR
jgi:ABC-type multidrug transport system fused ATPase/permease subunit